MKNYREKEIDAILRSRKPTYRSSLYRTAANPESVFELLRDQIKEAKQALKTAYGKRATELKTLIAKNQRILLSIKRS